MYITTTLYIKLAYQPEYYDTLVDLLDKMMKEINYHLCGQRLLSYRFDGYWIYFDFEHSEYWDNDTFVVGMISGALVMAGIELV